MYKWSVGALRRIEVFFCEFRGYKSADRRLLSLDEIERAERFHFERDRQFFVFCRARLRSLIAEHVNASAERLRFAYGPMGKPSLNDGPQFNASHAGDWFALALTDEGPEIGVDIEHVHRLDDMLSMARHFFAPAEAHRLLTIAEAQRTRSFFECWTRKEAVIKATGEGVSRPLDSFEVAFGPGATPALLRIDQDLNPGWQMTSFEPAPEYLAALTSSAPWSEIVVKFA